MFKISTIDCKESFQKFHKSDTVVCSKCKNRVYWKLTTAGLCNGCYADEITDEEIEEMKRELNIK